MSVENDIRSLHKEIQKNIIVMLPERYKKVCLYASVIDGNQASNGEMFFYYFPSGILKKNPINVYQIPKIFDFEEEQYAKLEKALYASIKKLKKYCVNVEQNFWSNLTIIMEGTKYFVEYNYDDLINSEFDNYSRHIIWRYKYLDIPIESYTKKEREIIDRYFQSYEYRNSNTVIYEENIYEKLLAKNKVTIYDSVESHDDYIKKTVMLESNSQTKNQLVAIEDSIEDNSKSNHAGKNKVFEIQNPVKNQLLKNFKLRDYNEEKANISVVKILDQNGNNSTKNQLLNKFLLNDNKSNSNNVTKIIELNKNNGVKNQLLNKWPLNNNEENNTIASRIIEQEKKNGAKNQLLNF